MGVGSRSGRTLAEQVAQTRQRSRCLPRRVARHCNGQLNDSITAPTDGLPRPGMWPAALTLASCRHLAPTICAFSSFHALASASKLVYNELSFESFVSRIHPRLVRFSYSDPGRFHAPWRLERLISLRPLRLGPRLGYLGTLPASSGTMYTPVDSALQRARLLGTQFFYRFGMCVSSRSRTPSLLNSKSYSHCATHQIRLILVSSVVITSLLFPAIASYYSSQTQYFAGFTLRVLDSFLTPDDISSYFGQHDLRHLWENDAALRTRADSVARARCGMEGILREERVLVGSVSPGEGLGALDKGTLLSTMKLERRIGEALSARSIPCLQTRGGSCFVLSPSAFWNHDEYDLVSDDDVLDTLNLSQNISVSGVPITPDMVFAGRDPGGPSSSHIEAATFLVLTYFFPEQDCFGNDGHFQWLHALEDAGGDAGELVVLAQDPLLIALEVGRHVSL